MFAKLVVVLFSVLALAFALERDIRTYEVMLPMTDGVKLHTRIALPRDYVGKKFVTVMDRSPYGEDALELMADIFLPFGFVTVTQDMRGTQQSEGNFTLWHADAEDSFVTGNWVTQQEWSNGVIYTFGASADGLAAYCTAYESPDWLKAQYFIWSSSVGYEVIYPNGAYLKDLGDIWIKSTVPNSAEASLQELYTHEMQDDWWIPIEMTGNYNLVRWPSGFWAGWYDIFLVGNLLAYEGYNTQSEPSVRHQSRLTVDPLGHCQSAASYFKPNLIAGRTALAVFQAYETFGVMDIQRANIKNVTFYVMSSNDEAGEKAGLYWSSLEAFPTPKMTKYYLHGDKSVTSAPPSASESVTSTTFVYDPQNPVPSVGGNNLDLPCGPLDQKEVDSREDVIVFTSPVFAEELPMTGPLFADLYVSSDAIDTDFMVKIEDLYPTGEARLLQDSAIRMRWRQGGLTPIYMEKGAVYPAHLSLWNTSYVLAPGHALRVAITSSNTPRFDINRNNGHLLADADKGDFIVAKNTVYHSAEYPSSITLPVVNKRQIPETHVIMELQKIAPHIDVEALSGKVADKLSRMMIQGAARSKK